jgi:hypothetical protein
MTTNINTNNKTETNTVKNTVKTTNNNSFGYTGNVKVSVYSGKKKINLFTNKNNGTKQLFQFFADVLKSDYTRAETERPKYIQLFSAGKQGDDIPSPITYEDIRTPQKIVYQSTPLITLDNVANTYIVIFKFIIPFTQLSESWDNINLFALYSDTNYKTNNSPSAYFILKDGTKLGSLIDSSIPKNNAYKYSLYIEWKMSVNNPSN